MQCLLVVHELWEHGVTTFRSDEHMTYYILLRRKKSDVPSSMSALDCNKELEKLGDTEAQLVLPPPPLLALPPLQDRPILALLDEEDGGDVADVVPSAPEVILASCFSDDELPVPPPSFLVPIPPVAVPHIPPPIPPVVVVPVAPITIEGVSVSRKAAYKSATRSYAARWTVRCNIGGHASCTKSRSAIMDSHLGEHGTRDFLGCWLRNKDNTDAVLHSEWTPSDAEILAYRATL